MSESHVEQITDVDVLIESLLDEVLGFVAGQVSDTSV